MLRKKMKVEAGKTYTVRDAATTYTIIVGDLSEADSGAGSPTPESYSSFNIGTGSPSLNLGRIGSVYLDSVNKTLYTKDALGWDSGFTMGGSGGSSEFKVGVGAPSLSLSSSISAYIDMQSMTFHTRSGGSWDEGRLMRGSSGQSGKSVRFGSGPPIASLGADDEAYIDLNDFKIHTKTAGSWSSGQAFKGSNGQNGLNGKSLRFGNGLPSDSDGDDNEVYLDLSNFKIHSKSAGSWGSGAEFKGSRGNDGQNGKSVRFGNGAPAASLGNDDETYIDLDSFKIHSKSAGSWGSGHVFKGSDGAHGLNGKSIKFGNGAPSDADGDDDEVYLDLSSFKVHTKATGSWNSGLAFKGSNGDNGTDGQPGSDGKHGVSAQLTNDSDVISADSDGSGYDFTDTGGEFEIRSGGAKVSSGVTYYAGTSGTSTTSTVNGLTLTINSSGTYSLSGASWSQNFAKFTMRADYDGVTYTKVYKVTKARAGLRGSDGNSGSDGKDGTNGTDALTGHLSNEADVVSAANDGTGYSFSGTGGTFYVYSGKTLVSPSNFFAGAIGTSTTQIISGLTLSVNSSGVYSLSGASWTSDTASFTIRALYSGVTLTKTYKITKSKAGSRGDSGDAGSPGTDGEGVNKYVDSLFSDYSMAANTPRKLYYNDLVANIGNVVVKSGDATNGSTFTISSLGRYKVDLACGFKAIYAAGASVSFSVKLLVNDVVKRTVTGSNTSISGSETRYPNLDLSWIGFLPAGSTIKCEVERTSSGTNPTLHANAIDKTTFNATEEDTIISITKL